MDNDTKQRIENELMSKADSLRLIVSGLEHHEPFLKLVEMWRDTEKKLDATWHNIYDPLKLIEARSTKYASHELSNIIELLRADLVTVELELEQLRNPDKFESRYGGD